LLLEDIIIFVEKRNEYMRTLEKVNLGEDIVGFVQFIALLINKKFIQDSKK
jgi:hypothetical protein